MPTPRTLLGISALLLAAGVALGAFGAHGLKDKLISADMEIYNKAVLYHLIHALGIGMVALSAMARSELEGAAVRGGALLLIGVLIFSGSLYLLVLTNTRWLGAITPIGGTLLIAGWLTLAWSILRY
jgi:uncharacterized membrane protein YgdD (TMEM256/DUF423 family)